MMKSLHNMVAVAVVASAGLSGVASASGDYYDGVSAEQVASVDLFHTSGINTAAPAMRPAQNLIAADESVDNGDYYTGASRPQ